MPRKGHAVIDAARTWLRRVRRPQAAVGLHARVGVCLQLRPCFRDAGLDLAACPSPTGVDAVDALGEARCVRVGLAPVLLQDDRGGPTLDRACSHVKADEKVRARQEVTEVCGLRAIEAIELEATVQPRVARVLYALSAVVVAVPELRARRQRQRRRAQPAEDALGVVRARAGRESELRVISCWLIKISVTRTRRAAPRARPPRRERDEEMGQQRRSQTRMGGFSCAPRLEHLECSH